LVLLVNSKKKNKKVMRPRPSIDREKARKFRLQGLLLCDHLIVERKGSGVAHNNPKKKKKKKTEKRKPACEHKKTDYHWRTGSSHASRKKGRKPKKKKRQSEADTGEGEWASQGETA